MKCRLVETNVHPGVEGDGNFAVNVLKLLSDMSHSKLGLFEYFIASLRAMGNIFI
jgi:hypothetical protein